MGLPQRRRGAEKNQKSENSAPPRENSWRDLGFPPTCRFRWAFAPHRVHLGMDRPRRARRAVVAGAVNELETSLVFIDSKTKSPSLDALGAGVRHGAHQIQGGGHDGGRRCFVNTEFHHHKAQSGTILSNRDSTIESLKGIQIFLHLLSHHLFGESLATSPRVWREGRRESGLRPGEERRRHRRKQCPPGSFSPRDWQDAASLRCRPSPLIGRF